MRITPAIAIPPCFLTNAIMPKISPTTAKTVPKIRPIPTRPRQKLKTTATMPSTKLAIAKPLLGFP